MNTGMEATADVTSDIKPREAETTRRGSTGVIYSVDDVPPWYLCILLGLQHYFTAVGSLISIPILLSGYFCMDQDYVGIGELIATVFFVSGVCTLLQSTFGVRIPIVQGATIAFVGPTVAIMSQTECKYKTARSEGFLPGNFTAYGLPEVGSEGHRDIWMANIRQIQGAILVASVFEIIIGFSGIMGLFLRFIGPLTIAPTITLLGLSLTGSGARLASKQWWIALLTVALAALFSQYMRRLRVPCLKTRDGSGGKRARLNVLTLFPVLLAMALAWGLCAILTETDSLPTDPKAWGYFARTDRSTVISEAQWFRFPYPGQWGMPTVRAADVFGMLAGVLTSILDSIGDYYACARISGAPHPPTYAINRGIGIEGIGCIIAGAWGTGNGTTSFGSNIGAIGITKVGSRRVVQVGGIIMILLGCLGKVGALFTTIPDPVIGGMFIVTFGTITAVGISTLQNVDMDSSRNTFILGIALYMGLCLPSWLDSNSKAIDTGNDTVDQILTVLFSTNMFVGALVGCVLDNTIPGTDEERGIHIWRDFEQKQSVSGADLHVYDLPFQSYLNKLPFARYLPFCPGSRSSTLTDTTEPEGSEPTLNGDTSIHHL